MCSGQRIDISRYVYFEYEKESLNFTKHWHTDWIASPKRDPSTEIWNAFYSIYLSTSGTVLLTLFNQPQEDNDGLTLTY
jgi:hypothetical protein